MRLRSLALSLAPLFAASVAHAQAPGEVPLQPVVVAPVVAQPVVVAPVVVAPVQVAPVQVAPGPAFAPPPPPPIVGPAFAPPPPVAEGSCIAPAGEARESVMANRWSIGFSVGGMSLAPKGSPDESTGFAFGELALRYRLTRHLELELSAGGGRERTADDMDGDLSIAEAALSARWRFFPEKAWNLFAMGGIGGASLVRHDATDQERSDATQPFGMLGVGVERRFSHLALQAELRAVVLGKNHADDDDPAFENAAMSSSSTSDPIERGGASLSVGLSYYF
jgi:hypothetical protein